jgi:hypothetical protein
MCSCGKFGGICDMHAEELRERADRDGVWVAYHSDWSGLAIFGDEIDALRHAVSNSMNVGFAEFGADLGGGRYPKDRAGDTEQGET